MLFHAIDQAIDHKNNNKIGVKAQEHVSEIPDCHFLGDIVELSKPEWQWKVQRK